MQSFYLRICICATENWSFLETYFFNLWAPFSDLNFSHFSTMNQNCAQELILALFWHHFHLVYWMRRDLNPQPFDCELSLLTTRPDCHPLFFRNTYSNIQSFIVLLYARLMLRITCNVLTRERILCYVLDKEFS